MRVSLRMSVVGLSVMGVLVTLTVWSRCGGEFRALTRRLRDNEMPVPRRPQTRPSKFQGVFRWPSNQRVEGDLDRRRRTPAASSWSGRDTRLTSRTHQPLPAVMDFIRHLILLCLIIALSYCKTNSGCRRSDPDFNTCVENQLNSQKTIIKKGLPNLKIGPLDPLYIPKIRLRQGNGPVSLDLTSTDQIFRGLINYRITSTKIDLKNSQIEFTVTTPWIYISGKSKVEGKILAFPMNGDGDSASNYTMVTGKALLKGHKVNRRGKEHLNLDTVKFDMSVKKAMIQMSGLFNGNEELASAMNKVLSDNWELIFQEMKPVIDQTAEEIIKDYASKIFNHYSLDELFPE